MKNWMFILDIIVVRSRQLFTLSNYSTKIRAGLIHNLRPTCDCVVRRTRSWRPPAKSPASEMIELCHRLQTCCSNSWNPCATLMYTLVRQGCLKGHAHPRQSDTSGEWECLGQSHTTASRRAEYSASFQVGMSTNDRLSISSFQRLYADLYEHPTVKTDLKKLQGLPIW